MFPILLDAGSDPTTAFSGVGTQLQGFLVAAEPIGIPVAVFSLGAVLVWRLIKRFARG